MFKEKERLPVGLGGSALKEGEETLPLVSVKNEVLWVDSKVQLPFDMKQGEPSPLGLFLTPKPKKGEQTYNLEVHPDHGRSGILTRVIFRDDKGNLYRDVDLKGMGLVDFESGSGHAQVSPVSPTSALREHRVEGIQKKGWALNEMRRVLNFIEWGIRTYRIIGIIELKEIIDSQGNKMSVSDARNRRILFPDTEPVITVRAYGTRSRISETKSVDPKEAFKKFEDARLMVCQETGNDPEEFGWLEYAQWFMENMGRSIGKMHGHKMVHGFLTDHNVTLDARLIDLDSVVPEKDAPEIRTRSKDIKDIGQTLGIFIDSMQEGLGISLDRDVLNQRFKEAYAAEVSTLSD